VLVHCRFGVDRTGTFVCLLFCPCCVLASSRRLPGP
jgi:protein tyrosine phosphatase